MCAIKSEFEDPNQDLQSQVSAPGDGVPWQPWAALLVDIVMSKRDRAKTADTTETLPEDPDSPAP